MPGKGLYQGKLLVPVYNCEIMTIFGLNHLILQCLKAAEYFTINIFTGINLAFAF